VLEIFFNKKGKIESLLLFCCFKNSKKTELFVYVKISEKAKKDCNNDRFLLFKYVG